jgi:hypothetical protein
LLIQDIRGARAVLPGSSAEAGLEPWEVDRLLYHQKEFLTAIEAADEVSNETEL